MSSPHAAHRAPYIRRFLAPVTAILTALALALTGCSLSSSGGGDKVLTVAIWKGYGADLPWVAQDFKAKTGATLRFQYIDSEDNLIQLMSKADGSIDVGLPNLQYIGRGIDQGVFLPLDTGRLDNYNDLYKRFSGLGEIRSAGKLYGLPWTWGSTGLFYNAKDFPTAQTSLNALWDPANKGKVAVIDDANVVVPITALRLGLDPQNPDMSKIRPALAQLKSNAKTIYSSGTDLAKAISTGTVDVGIGNSDEVGGIEGDTPGLTYTIAHEGAVGWIDNWAISAKSKHQDLAYQWLNYMTSSDFLNKYVGPPANQAPAPANETVAKQFNQSILDRLQANPDKIDSLVLQLPEPADRLQAWNDAWQEAKAS